VRSAGQPLLPAVTVVAIGDHSQPGERAAKEARDGGGSSAPGGAQRRDLRELPTFTIDPIDARDFDDAISAEELDGDRARVWVHIADVSAYVRPEGVLELEAFRRGTSVYVPGAVEPAPARMRVHCVHGRGDAVVGRTEPGEAAFGVVAFAHEASW